jgi:serine/threonine protein kinase
VALLADVAGGLAELHARGIPHNSLTPGCCLLEGPSWRGQLDLPLPLPFLQAAGLGAARGELYPVDYRWAPGQLLAGGWGLAAAGWGQEGAGAAGLALLAGGRRWRVGCSGSARRSGWARRGACPALAAAHTCTWRPTYWRTAHGSTVLFPSSPGTPCSPSSPGRAPVGAPRRAPGAATGPEADVWSLGCVLLQAVTGRKPWGELDEADISAKVGCRQGRCWGLCEWGKFTAASALDSAAAAMDDLPATKEHRSTPGAPGRRPALHPCSGKRSCLRSYLRSTLHPAPRTQAGTSRPPQPPPLSAPQLSAGDEAPTTPAHLPGPLRELLGSCLALDPRARPTALAVAAALRTYMLELLEQGSRALGAGAAHHLRLPAPAALKRACPGDLRAESAALGRRLDLQAPRRVAAWAPAAPAAPAAPTQQRSCAAG